MHGLADIVVHYLCLMEFSDDENIDVGFAANDMEQWPSFFAALSHNEKQAVSEAAKRTRDFMLRPPDEYGYHPALLVAEDQKAFLEALISGEEFGQE